MHAPLVIGHLLVAVGGTGLCYFLLRDRTSSKIRQSMWWPLAALAYINIAAFTVQAWFQLIEDLGIELPPEDVGVPILFCIVLALIAVIGYFKVYRVHRRMMREIHD